MCNRTMHHCYRMILCLDVSAQGFWGDYHQRVFFDVCVFNPNAPSYRKMQLPPAHHLHERHAETEIL